MLFGGQDTQAYVRMSKDRQVGVTYSLQTVLEVLQAKAA